MMSYLASHFILREIRKNYDMLDMPDMPDVNSQNGSGYGSSSSNKLNISIQKTKNEDELYYHNHDKEIDENKASNSLSEYLLFIRGWKWNLHSFCNDYCYYENYN